jgi:YHS domain-containing protein
MRRWSMSLGILAVLAVVVAVAVAAPREAAPRARKAAEPTPAPGKGSLEVVGERSTVCMVNDQDMQKPQIPVVVEGRTYYGCCAMCKDRLQQSPAARTAVDPVSGRTVDKAKAVIGRRPDGSVVYFEKREHLDRYQEPAAKPTS